MIFTGSLPEGLSGRPKRPKCRGATYSSGARAPAFSSAKPACGSQPDEPSSPWWAPHVYADRRPFLLARSRIAAAVRAWFAARDFVEVETAILQVSPGNEAHLHAFATELIAPGRAPHAALSAHLAGVRRQEAAGGRGAAAVHLCARVPQPRARPAASSRVHHARMVSGERALRRADRGLRGAAGGGGRGGRDAALRVSRARSRSVRAAGAADGRGGVSPAMPASICSPTLDDRDALAAAATGQGHPRRR